MYYKLRDSLEMLQSMDLGERPEMNSSVHTTIGSYWTVDGY